MLILPTRNLNLPGAFTHHCQEPSPITARSLHPSLPGALTHHCQKPSPITARSLHPSLPGAFTHHCQEPSPITARSLHPSLPGTFTRHCQEPSPVTAISQLHSYPTQPCHTTVTGVLPQKTSCSKPCSQGDKTHQHCPKAILAIALYYKHTTSTPGRGKPSCLSSGEDTQRF